MLTARRLAIAAAAVYIAIELILAALRTAQHAIHHSQSADAVAAAFGITMPLPIELAEVLHGHRPERPAPRVPQPQPRRASLRQFSLRLQGLAVLEADLAATLHSAERRTDPIIR